MTQVPVTVLTGYLGAGKTTLLNRILTADHGKRFAVIVNELGEAGIDGQLVAASDEEIFEMNNGCVCCTVRGDLIRTVSALVRRKGRLDGILLETTGLADPAPVIQTFFLDEETRSRARLDSVVTVVDAVRFADQLAQGDEARDQVVFADCVVLNKADQAGPEALQKAREAVAALNPQAEILTAARGDVPVEKLLGRASFDLARMTELSPGFLEGEVSGHHARGVGSVSLTAARPVNLDKFKAWLGGYANSAGADLYRCKGVLALPGASQRFVFQGVHMSVEMGWGRPWRDDETPVSKAVFIGRNLDRLALEVAFNDCLERP